jgi:hypothetical protein
MARRGFESFQASAFFANFPPASNAAQLWSQHFPTPYAAFSQPNPAVSVASGVVDNLQVELQLQPQRIDLVVRPQPQGMGPPPVSTSLNSLSDRAIDWLFPMLSGLTVIRQAAVATHSSEVADFVSASMRMQKLLPGLPIKDGDQDITFQLSRRTSSAVQKGLEINRLCKWSTATGLEMTVPIGLSQTSFMPGRQHFMVEEMLDVNTHPDVRPESQHLLPIYRELVGEIERIHTNGMQSLG